MVQNPVCECSCSKVCVRQDFFVNSATACCPIGLTGIYVFLAVWFVNLSISLLEGSHADELRADGCSVDFVDGPLLAIGVCVVLAWPVTDSYISLLAGSIRVKSS